MTAAASVLSSVSPTATQDLDVARDVLRTEINGLEQLITLLDHSFSQAVDLIMGLQGRVIVTGMGKSGHIGRKIAAILASTGTPSFFVHPAEASHGDMGMITRDDCVIAISNGGEAPELRAVLTYCKLFRVPLIAITSKNKSSLAIQSDLVLLIPQAPEACPLQKAPTTSTMTTMGIGDALAVALMKRRNFSVDAYSHFHPGGSLGGKLIKVADIMRQGDMLPLVPDHATVADAVAVMSKRHDFGFWGRAVIVDGDNHLQGYFSDGDLRRNLAADLLQRSVRDLMNPNPLTIDINAMAAAALALMNDRHITELVVLDGRRVRGLIRLHDILAAGVVA